MPDEVTSPPPPPLPFYPAPYATAPRRRSAWFYIAVIGGSCALVALVVAFALPHSNFRGKNKGVFANSDQIAVVDITGVILSADKIDAEMRGYADDDTVKAIVLHINSPGGASSPSQEIYNEVLRLRHEHPRKKIVASIDSVGASGAYYIASACDRIYANQASIVGSIGVVMEWTNYGELMRWAKLKSVDIHAGDLKTAGDPARDPTPKEQAYFQSLVDNMYGQFIRDVAVARHTTEDKIKPLATGQVWTGQQALGLGLIDREGGFRVALMDAAHDAGISGEPTVLRTQKQNTLLSQLLSGTDDLFPNPAKLLEHEPGFYFLWK